MKRLLILAALLLPGCGLHPLYGGGTSGPVATRLATIEVAPIAGKAGWLMANALRDRIAAAGSAAPLYRLDVTLDDRITGLGTRLDNSVTRERRSLRARYQLVRLSDNAQIIDATAGSDAGLDVVGSEYATIAAENSALENLTGTIADQIVARLGVDLRAQATK